MVPLFESLGENSEDSFLQLTSSGCSILFPGSPLNLETTMYAARNVNHLFLSEGVHFNIGVICLRLHQLPQHGKGVSDFLVLNLNLAILAHSTDASKQMSQREHAKSQPTLMLLRLANLERLLWVILHLQKVAN